MARGTRRLSHSWWSKGLALISSQIEISHGDTANIPFGMGTYGSRSLAVGGEAIVRAMDKVIAKATKIAAHILEASEADVTFENGSFTVAGTDKKMAFGEVALCCLCAAQLPA